MVLQNRIAWIKAVSIGERSHGHFKPVRSGRFLNNVVETVFHFTKHGHAPMDRLAVGVPFQDKSNIARRGHASDRRCAGNAWFVPYPTVRSKAQKFDHPAGFPVELARRCILFHGRPGAPVLDPFMGAGTTLVAADALGHPGIGIDIDPAYALAAMARLEAASPCASATGTTGPACAGSRDIEASPVPGHAATIRNPSAA